MSRQLRTLVIGAVLTIALGTACLAIRVPYIVLTPGPTINVLGQDDGKDIISISGHPVNKTEGHLNLTTVAFETSDTTVIGAVKGWLAGDEVVVPHDSVYPPGQTEQQTNEQDQQDFVQSQDSATAAAACELKYPRGFGILTVQDDSPNKGVLEPGDQFISFNGQPVSDDASLRAALKSVKVGESVPAVVNRHGTQQTLTIKLGSPSEGSTDPRIGVTVTEGCLLPFEVKLGLGGIGGPSAGLMFALAIIDKIGTDNLTGGRFIAGTGTIDPAGEVGPIGGIQLKMLGARRAGATVFLAPQANCGDVRGSIPSGLTVIKVATLHDAITSLHDLQAGKTDLPHC